MNDQIEQAAKEMPHESSENCWCRPRLNYVDPVSGNRHWVHHTIEEMKEKGLMQ